MRHTESAMVEIWLASLLWDAGGWGPKFGAGVLVFSALTHLVAWWTGE